MNRRNLIEGCIKQFKVDNQIDDLSDSNAFELFCVYQFTKNIDVNFGNLINSIVDGGNDGGIDSILIIIDNKVYDYDQIDDDIISNIKRSTIVEFMFVQCKKESSFKESPLNNLIATFPELFSLENNNDSLLDRFNPGIVDRVKIIKDIWQKTTIVGGKLNIHIIYGCVAEKIEITGAFQAKQRQLVDICKEIFSIKDVTYKNCSAQELLDLHQVHRTDRLTLKFIEQPLFTKYEGGVGYIGLVKLSDYKDFISNQNSGEIREDLFESNVRSFEGSGRDVNRKIQNTLIDISNKDFWWLNNGITIIAESPCVMGRNVTMENVQIVNGLQTSVCIYRFYKAKKEDERTVLVKVIINTDKNVIDNIIESTNYQNPISPSLLRATEKIQKEIEIAFLDKGYFYERRKNYYKNHDKPGSHIFSMLSVAQSYESIVNNRPDLARSRPTFLMKNDKTYKSIFNEGVNPQLYLQCCIITSRIHSYILNLKDKAMKSDMINFKMHIAFILPMMFFKSINININDILSIDILDDNIKESMELLRNSIDKYVKKFPDVNLINMAKANDFTLFLKDDMKEYFKNFE